MMLKTASSKIFPLCLVALLAAPLTAQQSNRVKFGFQGSASFPLGDYGDTVGPGVGGTFFLEKGLGDIWDDSMSIRGSLYYHIDGEKEEKWDSYYGTDSVKSSASSVGFLADLVFNIEYGYPGLYVFAGGGFNSTKLTLDYVDSYYGSSESDSTTSGFSYSLGAGYYFTKNLGAEIRYVASSKGKDEDKATLSWVKASLTLRF
jgi:hypothetical protein